MTLFLKSYLNVKRIDVGVGLVVLGTPENTTSPQSHDIVAESRTISYL